MAEPRKSLPKPTPETQPFWDGCREGELRLQRCDSCNAVTFPPRPFCSSCGSRGTSWFKASGRGVLWTYVINQRPMPGFEAPYAIAVVKLDEGPTMMTSIVECPQTPEALQLDMPVEVVFDNSSGEIAVPNFRPVRA